MSVDTISTTLLAATSTPPAGPYDLTDLATVHDEFQIPTATTADDAFLSRAITQTSVQIANFCQRVFAVETVQDLIYPDQYAYPWQDPALISPLQLSRFPLVAAVSVSFTGNTHGTSVVDGLSSTAGLSAGMPVNSLDGSVASVIESVGSGSITLVSAASSSETGLALTAGLQVVQQLAAPASGSGNSQLLVYGKDYTVDALRGQLVRLNNFTGIAVGWEAVPTTVQYQAGYTAIPSDLVDACLRMVTMRYTARGRDPLLTERTMPALGTERWWAGAAPGQRGSLPTEIEALLANYRVPVNA